MTSTTTSGSWNGSMTEPFWIQTRVLRRHHKRFWIQNWQAERPTNFSDHRRRALSQVRGGEAEQPEAGVGQAVLAPIVIDQARPMDLSVVFDPKARLEIEEIDATQESAVCRRQRDLGLWPRQPAPHEQHPQASLHRRFGSRVGVLDGTPECFYAVPSAALPDPSPQRVEIDPAGYQGHVDEDDSLRQRAPAAEIGQSATHGRRWEASNCYDVTRDPSPPDAEADPSGRRPAVRHDDLDRIPMRSIKPLQPGRRPASEHAAWRKALERCLESFFHAAEGSLPAGCTTTHPVKPVWIQNRNPAPAHAPIWIQNRDD